MKRYACPACNFTIYNRRTTRCESCGAELPSELLFTPEQKTALDAEYERNRKAREAEKRRQRESSSSYGGEGSWDGEGGDGGGGGGD
ncbi:MAG: hypothetical protein H7Y02_11895 [Candidatus Obscuribacterales bacterium]|nr:hypothetical protein [Steroidobacteraceae bacterium]